MGKGWESKFNLKIDQFENLEMNDTRCRIRLFVNKSPQGRAIDVLKQLAQIRS